MEFQFRFGLLAIEGMFNLISSQSFKAGSIVDRKRFCNTPGALQCTPAGLLKLFDMGVIDLGWVAHFPPPQRSPVLVRNGRN